MAILAGYIVPHPPLIVPSVGRGQEKKIASTTDSYHAIANDIAALAPDTIVVISPHATMYADYLHISPGRSAKGSLRNFGSSQSFEIQYDEPLVAEIAALCREEDFPAGTEGETDPALDHGTMVPLHFVQEAFPNTRYLRIGISGLSLQEHYRFGMLVQQAAQHLKRRVIMIASGDLSHKLKADGPYGFSPDGPVLDAALQDIMRSGNFNEFFRLSPSLCENAAECGLRGFVIMAGALDRCKVNPRLLSYAGPFGVGYAVASFAVVGEDASRCFLAVAQEEAAQKMKGIREAEDPYVKLARETLEHYIKTGKRKDMPEDLPEEMVRLRAGAFVSIKKHGNLRGCIGTTEPTQKSLAMEIIQNAISSGTRDPRFSPIQESELADLVYSVDVLSPAEPVEDKAALDVKRYGVIVTRGNRRGLLLPNLEGVDSIDQQLAIACQKAGISPSQSYEIERFEVVRHT